ncbi:unnamed protein product, partial [Discosporangium mesarthrocarpum]
ACSIVTGKGYFSPRSHSPQLNGTAYGVAWGQRRRTCCHMTTTNDIQSSLRRLQDSIKGLADASALVDANSHQPPPDDGARGNGRSGMGSGGGDGGYGFNESSGGGDRSSPSSFRSDGRGLDAGRREELGRRKLVGSRHSRAGSTSSTSSSVGPQRLNLGAVGGVRESTESRAVAELEDLRAEKESFQLMKAQLAAVQELRLDLQRKDTVIQGLQLKVQELQGHRDRAEHLETNCHLLEDRCAFLEGTNRDLSARIGALDAESQSRVEGLTREVDELQRKLRESERDFQAERSRYSAQESLREREAGVAQAELSEARGLLEDLKASLKESSLEIKRGRESIEILEGQVGCPNPLP